MVAFTIRGKITRVEPSTASDYVLWVKNGYFGELYCVSFIAKSMFDKAEELMNTGEDVEVLATLAVRNRITTSKTQTYMLVCEEIAIAKKI